MTKKEKGSKATREDFSRGEGSVLPFGGGNKVMSVEA